MKKSAAMLLALAVPVSVFPAERQTLCAGWKNPIAEDLQISETDLTAEAVEKARAFLDAHPEQQPDIAHDFGVENRKKILTGYGLKRAAETSGKPEDLIAFCTWITKEGFWYD